MFLNIEWWHLPLIVALNFWLGFMLGKLHERVGWNLRLREAREALHWPDIKPATPEQLRRKYLG